MRLETGIADYPCTGSHFDKEKSSFQMVRCLLLPEAWLILVKQGRRKGRGKEQKAERLVLFGSFSKLWRIKGLVRW